MWYDNLMVAAGNGFHVVEAWSPRRHSTREVWNAIFVGELLSAGVHGNH